MERRIQMRCFEEALKLTDSNELIKEIIERNQHARHYSTASGVTANLAYEVQQLSQRLKELPNA